MLRMGHAVAACALALLVLGVIMVNSASMSVRAHDAVTFEAVLLSRPALYMVVAMFAMAVGAVLPVRRLLPASLRDGSTTPASEAFDPPGFLRSGWLTTWFSHMCRLWPVWALTGLTLAVLASAYVPGIASPRKGAHRWITLHVQGLDSIQPSEFAKWGLILIIAGLAARFPKHIRSFWFGLVPGLVAAGVVSALIVIEDLGTGALVGMVACVVLVAAGARWWHLALIAPIPLAGATLAIVTSPYRIARIEAFINPYLDPLGKGFHSIQSMATIAGGDVAGRGLGNGLQKFGYLPEDTTDFLFSIICEELGVAGAALVIALLGGLLWSILLIVRAEKNPTLKLVGLGVLGTLGIQAVINLAVVTGLGPTKGIALPLLSSGGTGWVLTAGMLGLVIAIDRTQALASPKPRSRRDARGSDAQASVVEVKSATSTKGTGKGTGTAATIAA